MLSPRKVLDRKELEAKSYKIRTYERNFGHKERRIVEKLGTAGKLASDAGVESHSHAEEEACGKRPHTPPPYPSEAHYIRRSIAYQAS